MVSDEVVDSVFRELKRLVAKKAEDDEAMRFLCNRTRDQTEGATERPRGVPWRLPADFSVPCPGDTRPRSALGRMSFHFDQSIVSKTANGSKVTSSTRTRFVAGDAASENHDYIHRSALLCEAAMYSAYACVQPDRLDPLADALVPTPGARTRRIWWSPEKGYFTNIHQDPHVVDLYWPAVHRSERRAGLDRLRLKPGALAATNWSRIADDVELPAEARPIFLAAAAVSRGNTTGVEKRLVRAGVKLSDEDCERVLELTAGEVSQNGKPAVTVSRGRGGRTQYRLVAELPADLDDTSRILAVRELCEHLNALGLMWEAVIHAPGYDNDKRNYHVHVIYHDRPADYVETDGVWDLERRERVPGRPGRFRALRPKIKLGPIGVTRKEAGTEFLRALRELWADIVNNQLSLAGKYPRYDPRTYAEMGIDQEPAEHLDNHASQLALAAVLVDKDVANAERYWSGEWRRRMRRLEAAQEERADLAQRAGEFLEDHSARANAENLACLLGEFIAASDELTKFDRALAIVDLYEDMARSKAARTKAAAIRLIAAIDRGEASAIQRKYRPDIVERGVEAHAYMSRIDALVAPLAPFRRRRSALLALIDKFQAKVESLLPNLSSMLIDQAADDEVAQPSTEDPRDRLLRIYDTIIVENLPVVPGRDGRVTPRTVIGLASEEAAFLEGREWRGFLSKRFEFQERELGRLRAYKRKHREIVDALLLERASDDIDIPKAIRTLLNRYLGHPEIRVWWKVAFDEAARLEDEADPQRQCELDQEEKAEAEALLRKMEKEQGRLLAFFSKAKESYWRVGVFGGPYKLPADRLQAEGIADLIGAAEHADWVQERYAEIADAQRQTRERVLAAIAAQSEVTFDQIGRVSARSFPGDLRPLFEATKEWPEVSAAALARAHEIEQAAIREVRKALRQDLRRVHSIDANGLQLVSSNQLTDKQKAFLERHRGRPAVQEALSGLANEQKSLLHTLLTEVTICGGRIATVDGRLDPDKLSGELREGAKAWREEPRIVDALKTRIETERAIIDGLLERIDRENFSFERTPSWWRFDDRLTDLDRHRLGSAPHRHRVNERLKQIDAARSKAAEAARLANLRRAEERAHEVERRLISATLTRIEKDGLAFDLTKPNWELDPALSQDEQRLLRAAAHADSVKPRLDAISAERQHKANEEAKARAGEQQRLSGLLTRIDNENLAFDLEAECWSLDPRLSDSDRALLRSPGHREAVEKKLIEIAADRRLREQEAKSIAEESRKFAESIERENRVVEPAFQRPRSDRQLASAAEATAAPVSAAPSRADWERTIAAVETREIFPSLEDRSVYEVLDLSPAEAAILNSPPFMKDTQLRLAATAKEIENAIAVVRADDDEGMIVFGSDGPDFRGLSAGSADLLNRHQHRDSVQTALEVLQVRRQGEPDSPDLELQQAFLEGRRGRNDR